MNKFEQLIEYVINDEDQKARELFHDIVVAKSREIYENLMQEELDEDLDEAEVNEADDEDETDDEELDEGSMGGDASDDLIDEIEADEEQDMSMEAEGDDEMGDDEMGDDEGGDFGGDDMGGDMGGSDEPATKDDVMNLEDKLDELMAEFEGLMGGGDDMGDGDGFGPEEGGDAIGMDDTGEMEPGMMEAVTLKAAPKPVTSEEGNTNKKSTVAANSGARGAMARPVHTGADGGGHHDSSAYKNTVKDMSDGSGHYGKPGPATKPHLAQAAGVNTKSPLPSGRKG